jgi:hypothetical protein
MVEFSLMLVLLLLFLPSYLSWDQAKPPKTGLKHQIFPGAKFNSSGNFMQRLPIIFVYTVVPAVCKHGLPSYIRQSLEQALFTQPDCEVILASNFADCELILQTLSELPGLVLIDTTVVRSKVTEVFANKSTDIFASDYSGELWVTSALRFFILEDIMNVRNFKEFLHVEADNTIYGKISSILPMLRDGYPMAATPLTANKGMITASVFWISSKTVMRHFNQYMLDIALNTNHTYSKFLQWLRRYACCKKGGVDPDQHGNGIKPFAINEMSMLAYYREVYPNILKVLPVVPSYPGFHVVRPFCNVSAYSPGGTETGPATDRGIWDPNSWGQYIGGTSRKKGRDKGFKDTSHIAGQAIILGKCRVEMRCGNQTVAAPKGSLGISAKAEDVAPIAGVGVDRSRAIQNSSSGYIGRGVIATSCYTAPFVKCSKTADEENDMPWIPLWNLHVHSKHVIDFRSRTCFCP